MPTATLLICLAQAKAVLLCLIKLLSMLNRAVRLATAVLSKMARTMHLSLPILLRMLIVFIFIRVRFHEELSALATAYLQVLTLQEESQLCAIILLLIFSRLRFVRFSVLMLNRPVSLLMKPRLDLTLLISIL